MDLRDISVVVQGPVVGGPGEPAERRHTQRCLESVRRHLPGAEVVLSTWAGSDLSGLSYDLLVESEDPGALSLTHDPADRQIPNNVNRLVVSTRNGLLAATRPFAMKLRSDLLLTGTGFLRYFGRYRARCERWRILQERVVTPTTYARNPRRRIKYPFHPSDWFYFGRHADVLNIWDVPLAPEPETSRWYDTRPLPELGFDYFLPRSVHRYAAEQYVWTSFLRKHGELRFDHRTDLSHDAITVSELTMANNLVIVEPERLGIRFLKYPLDRRDRVTLYTHREWQQLYRRHCDPWSLSLPDVAAWRTRASDEFWLRATEPAKSMRWMRGLRDAWSASSPRTFRIAHRVYFAAVSAMERRTHQEP